jgi:enamine deaminase RidA (YjgF/YER057c/UK114 family)
VDRPVSDEALAPSPHRIVNPPELVPAVGFSHAVVAAPGRTIYLGGQTGHGADGSIPDSLVEQFDAACANVVTALAAAGARPEHLVSLQIYATNGEEYRRSLEALGAAYRHHFGRHYPAAAFFEVKGLFDPTARVELVAAAVAP